MRIAVLANLKSNAPLSEELPVDVWDDLDSEKTIHALVTGLENGGHEVAFFEANIFAPFNLIEKLLDYKPDICFNIAEGHFGDSRETQIPAVLEILRIPYTGSKLLTLSLALDKPMTKRILYYHDLPTPEFQVFETADEPIHDDLIASDNTLHYPLFVKPSREGTSVGVTKDSIVSSVTELREQLKKQLALYNQPILVEHYVGGREVTVGVVGNLAPRAARRLNERVAEQILPETLTFFPPLEINLDAYPETEAGVYTNRIKVELSDNFHYLCPAPLDAEKVHELNILTAAVFRVTGCKDVARVDFRLDADNNNKPYILEVNPLPGMNPVYSDICIEAVAGGWTYDQLVNTIVELAAQRQGILTKV